MVMADFCKAFAIVKYRTVLHKMSKLGFSKSYLEWPINYLCEREQFVQVDDKRSSSLEVNFRVPQRSIMGSSDFQYLCRRSSINCD